MEEAYFLVDLWFQKFFFCLTCKNTFFFRMKTSFISKFDVALAESQAAERFFSQFEHEAFYGSEPRN